LINSSVLGWLATNLVQSSALFLHPSTSRGVSLTSVGILGVVLLLFLDFCPLCFE
jgi:hypothetical protein